MKISGVIFDMDGTLLNSTEMWKGAASRYITSLRKEPEPDLGEKTKAMTLSGAVRLSEGRIQDRRCGGKDRQRL